MRVRAAALLSAALLVACGQPSSPCADLCAAPPAPVLAFTARSAFAGVLDATIATGEAGTLTISPVVSGDFAIPAGGAKATFELLGLAAATTYTVHVALASGGKPVPEDFTFTTPAGRKLRILFDAAHGEDAGAANWRIDDDDGPPQPATVSHEDEWDGALSSWAFALARSGRYELETLGTGGTLTFGDEGAQDLSKFDALVLPEPNNWGDLGTSPRNPAKGRAERDAVARFVQAGGGLLMLADHAGSDRDNDGIDSPRVLKPLLDALGAGVGFNNGKEYAESANFAAHPVVRGSFGVVARVGMYAGTTFLVPEGEAPGGRGVVFRDGLKPDSHLASLLVYGAAGASGDGRWFLYGDSSIAGDGTGRKDTPEKAAWGAPGLSHGPLLLNATAWAAHEY